MLISVATAATAAAAAGRGRVGNRCCLVACHKQWWIAAASCCSSPPISLFPSSLLSQQQQQVDRKWYSSTSSLSSSSSMSLVATSSCWLPLSRDGVIPTMSDRHRRDRSKFFFSTTFPTNDDASTTTTKTTTSATTTTTTIPSSSSPVLLHYDWVTTPPNAAAAAKAASASSSPHYHLVVVLHGLLGNGKNVRTLAKKYCETLQQQQQQQLQLSSSQSGGSGSKMVVYGVTMDLRGHGQSSSGGDNSVATPVTIQACAQDVHATVQEIASQFFVDSSSSSQQQQPLLTMTLIGHSWGGRVVLQYTHDYCYVARQAQQQESSSSPEIPVTLVETWILDSPPGTINNSVERVLQVVQEIEQQQQQDGDDNEMALLTSTRQWTDYLIQRFQFSKMLAQWLASSIILDHHSNKNASTSSSSSSSNDSNNQKKIQFIFDSRVAMSLLPEFAKQDIVGLLEEQGQMIIHHETSHHTTSQSSSSSSSTLSQPTSSFPHIHLVRAGSNASWKRDMVPRLEQIQHPNFHMHVLPNTGHWLHVEDLPGLLHIMTTNTNIINNNNNINKNSSS